MDNRLWFASWTRTALSRRDHTDFFGTHSDRNRGHRKGFANASEHDLFLGFCDVAVHVGAQHLVEGQWRLYPGSICVTTAADRGRGKVRPGESVEVNRIFDHTAVGTFRLVVWFGPEAGRPWEYKAVTESFELH